MARWKLTEPEFYWLVGLLEGEGSFAYNYKSQGVRLDMTDEDTVYRAAAIMGRLGDCHVNISSRDNSKKSNWKDSYYVQVYGESARKIMHAVVKYMSYRRRQQIWRALNCRTPKEFKNKTNVISLEQLMKGVSNG